MSRKITNEEVRQLRHQSKAAFIAWLENKDKTLELYYKAKKELAEKDYAAAKLGYPAYIDFLMKPFES
jgi:hypothetical protein